MLTDFQKKKITLLFHFWDYDKSGSLQREDYAAVGERMAQARNWSPGSPEYQYLHKKLMEDWDQAQKFADTDNDNRITLNEWLVFCDHFVHDEEMYKITVTNIASAIIDSVDGDGDGKLSVEEWATIFNVYGWKDKAVAVETFNYINRDGDDYITKEELLAALDIFFKSDDEEALGNYMFGQLE